MPKSKKRSGGGKKGSHQQQNARKRRQAAKEEEEEDEEEMVDEVVVDGEEEEEEMMAAAEDVEAAEKVKRRILELEQERGSEERRFAWDPRDTAEGEELECDARAYAMLHGLGLEWPCLSFDVLSDDLGGGRTVFPHALTVVCGSQADEGSANSLALVRLSELGAMQLPEEDEDDDRMLDEDAYEDVDPVVESCFVPHPGAVRRVAADPDSRGVVATWSDDGLVRVWDLSEAARVYCAGSDQRDARKGIAGRLDPARGRVVAELALHTKGRTPGYALAWSSSPKSNAADAGNTGALFPKKLAAGDEAGHTAVFHMRPDGSTSRVAAWAGTASVEDVRFSPTEASVLVAVGCDRAVRVFDDRHKHRPMLVRADAHAADVNALSWNTAVSYLIATAGDDAKLKVWDLRAFGPDARPVGHFDYHRKPIAAIQWDPHDEAALACASEDHSVTLWDLAVEDQVVSGDGGGPGSVVSDPSSATKTDASPTSRRPLDSMSSGLNDLPPQLLFVHQGLHDPKDVKHHPQIPKLLIATAADGLSLFIPALEGAPDDDDDDDGGAP